MRILMKSGGWRLRREQRAAGRLTGPLLLALKPAATPPSSQLHGCCSLSGKQPATHRALPMRSLRTMTTVTPAGPMFFCAPA